MEIPVFDSIINGDLQPNRSAKLASSFNTISRALSQLPDNLFQAEKVMKEQLGDYVPFSFDDERAVYIGFEEEYHPVPQYKYPIVIHAFPAINDTPEHRFYSTIIASESKRIKMALIEFSAIAKADIDTRGEVKRTMERIYHLSLQLKSISQADVIHFYLKQQMIKLYYEVAYTFSNIIVDSKYEQFEDYYHNIFGAYPERDIVSIFSDTLFLAKAQLNLLQPNVDTEELKRLLLLSGDSEIIKPVVIWLKNKLLTDIFGFSSPISLDTDHATRELFRAFTYSKEEEYKTVRTKAELIHLIESDIELLSGISGQPIAAPDMVTNWLNNRLTEADSMPGSGVYEVQKKDKTTEIKEDLSPEEILVVDRATEFTAEVAPFQFETLDKVQALSNENRIRLIQKIVGESVPYGVAMLIFLGYDVRLQFTYKYNKTKIAEHFSKCLKSNDRTIRGNIAVLKNDSSSEDRSIYTAGNHEEEVKQYYEKLLKTN